MQFTIESEEGLPIRGNLAVPEKARGVVLIVHGFKGFKDWGFFPWLAHHFVRQHLAVCRFNMSRSGIGDDPESFDRLDLFEHDTYSTQLSDLATVARYVATQLPSLPAILLGHSRGGGVAILGAQEVPNLNAVIAWSPIARVDRWDDETKRTWRERGVLEVVNQRTQQTMRMSPAVLDDYEHNRERLDIVAAARALQVPLLVVHGERDESVPVDEGKLLASSSHDASLVTVSRASHTFNAIHPLIHVPFELVLASQVSCRFALAYALRGSLVASTS